MKDITVGMSKLAYVCPQCEGEGKVKKKDHIATDYMRTLMCDRCDGVGLITTEQGETLMNFIRIFFFSKR